MQRSKGSFHLQRNLCNKQRPASNDCHLRSITWGDEVDLTAIQTYDSMSLQRLHVKMSRDS